jgi:hypothetical protein
MLLNCLDARLNWIESSSWDGIDLDRFDSVPDLDIHVVCG